MYGAIPFSALPCQTKVTALKRHPELFRLSAIPHYSGTQYIAVPHYSGMYSISLNAFPTGNPFWGTKLLGFSIGRGSGFIRQLYMLNNLGSILVLIFATCVTYYMYVRICVWFVRVMYVKNERIHLSCEIDQKLFLIKTQRLHICMHFTWSLFSIAKYCSSRTAQT